MDENELNPTPSVEEIVNRIRECGTVGLNEFTGRDPTECLDMNQMALHYHIKNEYGYEIALLSSMDFSGKDLTDVDLSSAELKSANLSNTNLNRANLSDVSFDGANLEKANLSASNLEGASFRSANLQGTNMDHSDLRGVRAFAAKVDSSTRLIGCKYDRKTDFTGVDIKACQVDSRTLSDLKFNVRRNKWKKQHEDYLIYWLFSWITCPYWILSDYRRYSAAA